jgi:hypothetical protein
MADTALIVDGGMAIITNRLKSAGTEPNYTGWGVGTSAAAVADTALQSASAESRVAGTSSQQLTNVANDTYQVVTSIVCTGASKAVTEIGLFDAATVGNMFLHASFSAINVSVGDSISFTIKTVFDQG